MKRLPTPLIPPVRDDRWSDAIAVGSLPFANKVKSELGIKAKHREVAALSGTYTLREQSQAYASDFGETDALMPVQHYPLGEKH
jgi:hypothetical protein